MNREENRTRTGQHACLDPRCSRAGDPTAECSTRKRTRISRYFARLHNLLAAAADFVEDPSAKTRRAVEAARILAAVARVRYRHPAAPFNRSAKARLAQALSDATEGTFRRPIHPARWPEVRPEAEDIAASRGTDVQQVLELAAEEALWETLEGHIDENRGPEGPCSDLEAFLALVGRLPSRVGERTSRAILGEDHRRPREALLDDEEESASSLDRPSSVSPVVGDVLEDWQRMEERLDADLTLDHFRETLSEEERAVLAAVGASVAEEGLQGGEPNVADAHRRADIECSLPTFRRRWRDLRTRFRKVI